MTRILITGVSGLLGSNLALEWSKTDEIYGLFLSNRPELPRVVPAACNILDAEGMHRLLGEICPEIVVHAAAMTNVDACENDPATAWAVNVQGTANLIQACRACPTVTRHIIYISTDYVFSGLRGHYTEADAPSPVNVYGRTKLDGERMIMASPIPWTIIRTSFFGWSPVLAGAGNAGTVSGIDAEASSVTGSEKSRRVRRCFMEQSLASLESGNVVNAWTNRFSTPLLVNDLAQILIDIARLGLSGLWHAGSEQRVSNWQMLRYLSEHLGAGKSVYEGNRANSSRAANNVKAANSTSAANLVKGATFQSQPGLGQAERPFDTSLCSYRLQAALGRNFGDYQQAIQRWLNLRNSGYPFAVG
jgi:dTDP-4-dehydrorhamnose reductase